MSNVTPVVIAVLGVELVPAAAFGFAGEGVAEAVGRWPFALRVLAALRRTAEAAVAT